MAQEFAYLRLCNDTGTDTPRLIGYYSARARRIAATYARFYLEMEEHGNPKKKGRYYWMALGAFASKTVACTFEHWTVSSAVAQEVRNYLGKGTLSKEQQEAYELIAGDLSNLRLLQTSRCETSDKRLRRDWMRAAQKEPVYKPVGQAMSLPTRASADPYQLLAGLIDAEHDLARRQLEVKPPPPGTPMMSALPDPVEAEARRRQAAAQIEVTLAAPFVAAGTGLLAIAAAPAVGGAAAVEETTITANAGAKVIQFDRYLRAARIARAAGTAGATASAADKLAAQPTNAQQPTAPVISPEQQRQLDAYWAWENEQRSKPQDEGHYLFWPDAPRTPQ